MNVVISCVVKYLPVVFCCLRVDRLNKFDIFHSDRRFVLNFNSTHIDVENKKFLEVSTHLGMYFVFFTNVCVLWRQGNTNG